jgi:hypothetical protein
MWQVSAAFTALLVLAPPALTTFLIPWSPGGMLLQRINAQTHGFWAVVFCAIILIVYSFDVQYDWWTAQPTTQMTGLVLQQVITGIIGFIFIPALLWAPVSDFDFTNSIRQAHLVRRYELQVQADVAILRSTLMRAQNLAVEGIENLNLAEKRELSMIMRGLVNGIHYTLEEIRGSVYDVVGAELKRSRILEDPKIQQYLEMAEAHLLQDAYEGQGEADDILSIDQLEAAARRSRGNR